MASSGNTWFKKLRAKQLRNTQRLNGMRQRFAVDADHNTSVKKVRDYLAPVDTHYVPAKPRGRSGVRMSAEKRMQVMARHGRRAEFFASLGVKL